MEIRNETVHSMQRRSAAHDYRLPGFYHVTIRVAEGLGHPLGTVVGDEAAEARVVLTAVGAAVERELLTAISTHYPMVTVDAHVVMPEHLHFVLIVRDPLVSSSGRATHLGQVIAGFKQGCNRAYWAATAQAPPPAPPPGTVAAPAPPPAPPAGTVAAPAPPAAEPAGTVLGGFAAKKKERYASARPPLFAPGYCDVMPVEPGQLETIRAYIAGNPRSRWLRSHDRDRLQPQRATIDTALTPSALRGYLQRECTPRLFTPDVWAKIERRLLIAGGRVAGDSYGDLSLLSRRLLPVVCHRRDKPLFEQHRARCLQAAAEGAVLVSPRIAPGEKLIIDEAADRGFATVIVADNGFPPVYHPSADSIGACTDGLLLIVSPWHYEYRGKDETVSVPLCKAMNCVAQALCRQKDEWWKA